MVLQMPLLHALHCRYGQPCRLLTSGHWSSELFLGSVDVGEIWQLRARHAPLLLSPQRWRVAAALRKHEGPIYVSEDSERQLRHIRQLFRLSGIASDRCTFLTDHAIEEVHWVDRLLHFATTTPASVAADDYPASARDVQTAPRLNVLASDRADRDAWLLRRGLANRPLVLLQPANKRAIKWGRARANDSKAWPIECWVALLRAMHETLPDARLLLCGSPAEESLLAEIRHAASIGGVEIAARDLPLRRLLAVMETAHSMVAVDTGPAHMAAAVGCPLIVLYGNESPRVWGRRSPTHSPVLELGGPPEYHAAEQIPSYQVMTAWEDLARELSFQADQRVFSKRVPTPMQR
jgi:hypothetical protein